jgi:hypothetical protein
MNPGFLSRIFLGFGKGGMESWSSNEGVMDPGFLSRIFQDPASEGWSQFNEGDMNPKFHPRIILGFGKGGMEPIPTKVT